MTIQIKHSKSQHHNKSGFLTSTIVNKTQVLQLYAEYSSMKQQNKQKKASQIDINIISNNING
jgi:hypothetical protein